MRVWLVIAALCALGAAASAKTKAKPEPVDDKDVVILTKENFGMVLKKDVALVEFYAPWCPHCQAMAGEWAKTATALKGRVLVGKVDVTVEMDLAAEYSVTSLPTIKVFRNGKDSLYVGGRSARAIVNYGIQQTQSAATTLHDAASAKAYSTIDKVVIMGFAEDKLKEDIFLSVAQQLRDDFTFALVSNATVAAALGVKALPAVRLYRNSDKTMVHYKGKFVSIGIVKWIKLHSLLLVDEIGPHNYHAYLDAGPPLALFFVKHSASYFSSVIDTARSVAKGFKGRVNFVYVNSDKYLDHATKLGLSGKVLPAFAIEYPHDQKHFAYPETEPLKEDALYAFVERVLNGSISQNPASEAIPEKNDGPVLVAVGATYEAIVSEEKDVMMAFYDPRDAVWSDTLDAVYTDLGKSFEKDESVIIAKLDASTNEYRLGRGLVHELPTILFFPADSKDSPLVYAGEHNVDALRKFVQEHRSKVEHQSKKS